MLNKIAKEAAGKAAAELVQPGMIVGLGTGSTASCFIESLIKRCKEGLNISAVASSEHSKEMAIIGGIPLIDPSVITYVDLTCDGADEIDAEKRMIKGGGAALLREKIIASISNEMVVIVDETKIVKHLGSARLPVEIVPFAYKATLTRLKGMGYNVSIRKKENGKLCITDNGNFIADISFPSLLTHPEKEEQQIRKIPGVVETGFFFGLAGRVIVGHSDGHTQILP